MLRALSNTYPGLPSSHIVHSLVQLTIHSIASIMIWTPATPDRVEASNASSSSSVNASGRVAVPDLTNLERRNGSATRGKQSSSVVEPSPASTYGETAAGDSVPPTPAELSGTYYHFHFHFHHHHHPPHDHNHHITFIITTLTIHHTHLSSSFSTYTSVLDVLPCCRVPFLESLHFFHHAASHLHCNACTQLHDVLLWVLSMVLQSN